MHDETFVKSEEIFNGQILRVRRDTVILENGAAATREVVRHMGAVAIAPLNDKGELIFVRQFRYAVGREMLEFPAGKLDHKGENRLDCAVRELREETGYRADQIESLGEYVVSPGYCDETISLYFATGLREGEKSPDEDEFLDNVILPVDRAVQMVMDGEITDGKTQTMILKIARLLEHKGGTAIL